VPTSVATTARGGQVADHAPRRAAAAGSYTVRWRATGTDGDLVERNSVRRGLRADCGRTRRPGTADRVAVRGAALAAVRGALRSRSAA